MTGRATAGAASAALFLALAALWVTGPSPGFGAGGVALPAGAAVLAAVLVVVATAVTGRRRRHACPEVHVPEQRTRAHARVTGRVHTDARVDVAVTLVDRRGRLSAHALVERRDGGRYRLPVPYAGTWHLIVSAPGHVAEARRVCVESDQHDVHEDVALAPDPRRGR